MEEKLKLISGGTRWSLWLKSLAVSGSWYLFSPRTFLFVALLLYLFPVFDPFRLILPGAVFLFLATVVPKSFLAAICIGVLFFLIVGIKDLVLVRRLEAYQALVFLLIFSATFIFFLRSSAPQASFLTPLLALCLTFYFLSKKTGEYEELSASRALDPRSSRLGHALSALALLELGTVLVFLPLNAFYQTAIFFFSAVMLLDLMWEYGRGGLSKLFLLRRFSWFLAFLVVVLTLNSWEI